jgi:hypothetical protein
MIVVTSACIYGGMTMIGELMTREDAIEAIGKAQQVFAWVRISTSYDGTCHNWQHFPISKDLAINAFRQISDTEYEPNLESSDDGHTVMIGKERSRLSQENFSHFENNNGNF